MKAPQSHPCGSCPYRADVPSGVWSRDEYEKLPRFDGETHQQPPHVFLCHQQNGHICAGWAGCHSMQDSLGLRLSAARGLISPDDVEATLDYECPVELFESGQAAHDHGVADIDAPDARAARVIDKLERRREQ